MTQLSNELQAKILNGVEDLSVCGVSVELVKIKDGMATLRFNMTNENGHPMIHMGEQALRPGDQATILKMNEALKIKIHWS